MRIVTSHPLADWSPDHVHPKGAATDSTRHAGFNKKLFGVIPQPRLLDLGCAGGGLVASVIEDGGSAVGVDGSDCNAKSGRAEWSVIPDRLFTADLTYPFMFEGDDWQPVTFNVVTAWEVLEHIPEGRIRAVMDNVRKHLEPGGLFICSISTERDQWDGYDYHVTVHSRDWWVGVLTVLGWREDPAMFGYFDPDWVRGPANGMMSFPLVLRDAGVASFG